MSQGMRILNLADVSPFQDIFRPWSSRAEFCSMPPDRESFVRMAPECDGCIASLFLRLDRDLLALSPRLRVIGTPSTGTDHIDLVAAAELVLTVLSLKDDTEFLSQVTATAELAWGLLLATVRRLPWGFEAVLRGDWARDRFRGSQLSGKTLGILGYGR